MVGLLSSLVEMVKHTNQLPVKGRVGINSTSLDISHTGTDLHLLERCLAKSSGGYKAYRLEELQGHSLPPLMTLHIH